MGRALCAPAATTRKILERDFAETKARVHQPPTYLACRRERGAVIGVSRDRAPLAAPMRVAMSDRIECSRCWFGAVPPPLSSHDRYRDARLVCSNRGARRGAQVFRFVGRSFADTARRSPVSSSTGLLRHH